MDEGERYIFFSASLHKSFLKNSVICSRVFSFFNYCHPTNIVSESPNMLIFLLKLLYFRYTRYFRFEIDGCKIFNRRRKRKRKRSRPK